MTAAVNDVDGDNDEEDDDVRFSSGSGSGGDTLCLVVVVVRIILLPYDYHGYYYCYYYYYSLCDRCRFFQLPYSLSRDSSVTRFLSVVRLFYIHFGYMCTICIYTVYSNLGYEILCLCHPRVLACFTT